MKLSLQRIAVPLLVLSAAIGSVVLPAPQAGGGATNRAGVVVRHEDGTVRDMCVFFDEAEITGYELLERSGLKFESDSGGYGRAICNIEGRGCSTSDCLTCDKPNYWVYFTRDKGASNWTFSQLGADSRHVRDGYIDGWFWGDGNNAPKPPPMSFSDICPATATATTAPRPVPPSGGTSGGSRLPSGDGSTTGGGSENRTGTTETERLELEDPSPEPSAEDSPSATNTERNEARESTDEDDTNPANYLMFGGFALVFALLAAALYFMRRRRAQSDT